MQEQLPCPSLVERRSTMLDYYCFGLELLLLEVAGVERLFGAVLPADLLAELEPAF